jgi:tetratricopeptide (TPR) repeat protein
MGALVTAVGIVLGSAAAAAPAAVAEDPRDPVGLEALTAPLSRSMAAAEGSLVQQEKQRAESHFRAALLEGWMLQGALEAAEGNRAAARRAFERAATAAVETRRPNTALALLDLNDGATDSAIALLRSVVVRHPQSGSARRLLAQALVAADRPKEAVQELAEGFAARPDDLETAFALASGYLRLEKDDEAERVFAHIAAERPIPQTWILIGRTYRDFRAFDRARDALETALRLDPGVQRAHYYLGMLALHAEGAFALPEALEQFRQELERFPRDPLTNLYYGMALAETRSFETAIPALEIALEWPPTRLDALRFLGRCHAALDRPAKALDFLRQALTLARGRGARTRQLSGILYQLGQLSQRLGATEEAEGYLAEAGRLSAQLVEDQREKLTDFLQDTVDLEANPWDVQPSVDVRRIQGLDPPERQALRHTVETALTRATFNLGVLKAQSGSFSQAADRFADAAEIDPDFPQLATSLGVAAFNAQRYDQAAEALRRALEQDPANADLRRMLAFSWLNLEAYAQAAELLADDPRRTTDPSIQYAYALSLVRSGRADLAEQAEAVFQRLLAEHEDWPELHVLLGQAHAQDGDFDRAVAALERALELKADVAEAQLTLGILYLKQGRFEEAETALRGELAHHPEDLSARYHLAVVLDLNRRSDAAEEQLRAVLRTQPDYADARYLLGKIRLAAGAADEAVVHLEAAAALAPRDANIRYQLAQAYQRLGQRARANEEFASYRALKAEANPQADDREPEP